MNHARAIVAGWVDDYNTARPHSAIGYMTPAAYAATLNRNGGRRCASSKAPHRRPLLPSRQGAILNPRFQSQVDERQGSRQLVRYSGLSPGMRSVWNSVERPPMRRDRAAHHKMRRREGGVPIRTDASRATPIRARSRSGAAVDPSNQEQGGKQL